MITKWWFSGSFLFVLIACVPQKNTLVQIGPGTNTSIRGMSIPSREVIWVSGSNGTVGRSVNGGVTWQWNIVEHFEKLDFRDIEAFDSSTALIMAVDNPAYIFKTTDGGKNWKKTFEKRQEGMFLDAMDFKNNKEGICVGDPLPDATGNKHFFLIRTLDGGDTWTPEPLHKLPPASDGEAIFSASGTNIEFLQHPAIEYAFVTGGTSSNLVLVSPQGKAKKIPVSIQQGKASSGTFSMATDGSNRFYCVGGDYREPQNNQNNFSFTSDGGATWDSAKTAPFGYRSCIRRVNNKVLVSCGTNGIDWSKNGGRHWVNISKDGYNVCMVTKNRKQVFFAGEKGKLAKLTLR